MSIGLAAQFGFMLTEDVALWGLVTILLIVGVIALMSLRRS